MKLSTNRALFVLGVLALALAYLNHFFAPLIRRTYDSGDLHVSLRHDFRPWSRGGVDLELIRDVLRHRLLPVHAMLIVNNTLWHDAASEHAIEQRKKIAEYDYVLQDILQRRQVPDVLFVMNAGSAADDLLAAANVRHLLHTAMPHRQWREQERAGHDDDACDWCVPVLMLAAHDDFFPGAVRCPNPWLEAADTYRHVSELLQRAGERPWARRVPKAFYRGSVDQTNYEPTRPRITLATLANEGDESTRELFDVAFQSEPRVKQWVKNGFIDEREAEHIARVPVSKFVPMEELSRFKYLVNMPGHTKGSYSRALQYFLSTGAAVVHWQNRWREFYYDAMADGYHYVTVNESTIVETVRWLRDNDERARGLGEHARDLFAQHLTPDAIERFWTQLLAVYAEQTQQWHAQWPRREQTPLSELLVLEEACTCDKQVIEEKKGGAKKKCAFCDTRYKRKYNIGDDEQE